MNQAEQLQANLIIAKALGYDAVIIKTEDSLIQLCMDSPHVRVQIDVDLDREFNITNPSDCQAAVIALGEKRQVDIYFDGLTWAQTESLDDQYDTYQEAVAAAYLALEDK